MDVDEPARLPGRRKTLAGAAAARIRRFLKPLLIVLPAIGLVAGTWAYLHLRPLTVAVAPIERDVPVKVFGLGTVEARIVSQIGFESGGALVEINADHGDAVVRGAVLARLYAEEQAARVAKAEAALAQAQANLQRVRAKVASAEALLAQKRSISARRQSLVGRGATSEETAEDARASADIAAAELAVARSDVAVAEAAIKDAQAQVRMEGVLLGNHVLRAPFDALVTSRRKEVGAVVAPGEAVFTLIDPTTIWVRAYVDESLAGDLQVGQTAEVRLRSLPRRTFRGRVDRIEIESDRVTEERRVYVVCTDCPRDLFLGEQAEAYVTVARLDSALLVPERAIEKFDGTHGFVWIVNDGVLHRQRVAFGHRLLDGRIALGESLPAEAQVVVALPPGLREGRAARTMEGAVQ